ncbi:Ser/Thr protein phosphatase [Cladorrhinum sp. PSN259]|nr:Ser/Thr protein phosphatase [Cladorrhinum sp. PSN259]
MANPDTGNTPSSAVPHEPKDKVTLQVMSDLHLETPRYRPMYAQFNPQSSSPYLALLGDIGNAHDPRLYQFLREMLQKFDVVFYVLGNHEPYYHDSLDFETCTLQAACTKMENFEASISTRRAADDPSLGRFVFLNRRRFDLSDTVTLLGATLFSNVRDDQKSTVSLFMSDFSNISQWTVEEHNAMHQRDLRWLNSTVETMMREEPHRSVVILTHFSPTAIPEANDPEHADDERGVQSAFVTNLEKDICWTSPLVKVWAFGHTHFSCDFVDEKTGKRVVANQRGYGIEDSFGFDACKTVTVQDSL